jgi:hypothetical protein
MTMAARTECQRVESINVSVNDELYDFDLGRIYLILNPRSDRAFTIARDFVSTGHKMLCVSRYHPQIVQGMWVTEDFKSIWLSERHGESNIPAHQLSRLKGKIASFLDGGVNGVVMLDGIEYLSLFNDFSKLLRFIEELNDLVMELHAILLISVDPRSFDQRSLARLRRFAEVVQ